MKDVSKRVGDISCPPEGQVYILTLGGDERNRHYARVIIACQVNRAVNTFINNLLQLKWCRHSNRVLASFYTLVQLFICDQTQFPEGNCCFEIEFPAGFGFRVGTVIAAAASDCQPTAATAACRPAWLRLFCVSCCWIIILTAPIIPREAARPFGMPFSPDFVGTKPF